MKTRDPSIPSHRKLWWGRELYWFQESFWVRNQRMPLLLHDLGQRGRVAEHVGQPDVVGLDPQFVEVEPLAVDDLADQRLARGDVAVGLDPHAPGRLEASLGDPDLHPLPQLGVVLAHPGQVLGLGDHEPVLGVALHQLEHRAEGASALSDRLAERPQPRRVQMGVARPCSPWAAGAAPLRQQLVEHRLGLPPAVRDVGQLEQVAGPVESGAEPGGVGLAVGELGQQLDQDPEVVPEPLELGVPDVEVGLLEGEQGSAVGFGEQERPRIGAERGGRVGRRLDEELDAFSAGGLAVIRYSR